MRERLRRGVGVALVVLGAATAEGATAARASPAQVAAWRASRWVGLSSLRTVSSTTTDDCSGLVRLAFRTQRVALAPEEALPGEGGVAGMYRKALALGALTDTPRRGDLVFFRETYDRNRDRRRNDGLTHIGIVERVAPDGTVTFIHRSHGGVKRGRLNLAQPGVRRDARGRVLNDYLRVNDGLSDVRLAGELFAGFASVDARWEQADLVAARRAAPLPRRPRK
jgi:NlpC/P60 family